MSDVPVWPPELPQRVWADDYGGALQDAVQATPMAAGVPKTRLKTSAAVEPVQCSVKLSIEQLGRFRRFFHEEVASGSLPFLIRDQDFDGEPLAGADGEPLTAADGTTLQLTAWWLAMFTPGSPPQRGEAVGPRRRVSFQLIILP